MSWCSRSGLRVEAQVERSKHMPMVMQGVIRSELDAAYVSGEVDQVVGGCQGVGGDGKHNNTSNGVSAGGVWWW